MRLFARLELAVAMLALAFAAVAYVARSTGLEYFATLCAAVAAALVVARLLLTDSQR